MAKCVRERTHIDSHQNETIVLSDNGPLRFTADHANIYRVHMISPTVWALAACTNTNRLNSKP